MLKNYIIASICMLWIVGCTSKDTIPPMPPKSEKTLIKDNRTISEMEAKLNTIRNPIKGENIYKQKKNARREVDSLLGDAKSYKRKISRFEKAQIIAFKKAKKEYKHNLKKHRKKRSKQVVVYRKNKETSKMVDTHETKLKYY